MNVIKHVYIQYFVLLLFSISKRVSFKYLQTHGDIYMVYLSIVLVLM